ncbi:MAG: flagellin [Lachnospiraceae bacterium]|nr:flagellin [Lachnospiraceae bacterium]
MIIQHNMNADYTARMGKENQSRLQELTMQLGSGYRLLHSKNDAAGAMISQEMRSQIRGLDQANRNGQDGIYLLDVADGAAAQIHDMIQRLRELAVQSANDVYLDSDRQILQNEMEHLTEEVDRIAQETEYNTKKLIDGSLEKTGYGLNFQIGANSGQSIEVLVQSLRTEKIGLQDMSLKTRSDASEAISKVDTAIQKVSEIRGSLGSVRNRLGYAIANSSNMSECLQYTESRIADTNMADSMVKYSKESILKNSISAMLSQSIKHSNGIMALLKNTDNRNYESKPKKVSGEKVSVEKAKESIA